MIIYCDGGHKQKISKDEAWGSVTDEKGVDLIPIYKDLFKDMNLKKVNLPSRGPAIIIISKFDDVKIQQNNGAELMAMIASLRIACHIAKFKCDDRVNEIRCDSDLICKYWSKGKYSSTKLSKEKIHWINECTTLRTLFEGKIVKISGKDNIADLFDSH